MPNATAPGASPPLTRPLLACGLAPLLYITVMLLDGATRPGYDPIRRFASELSLGDRGWIQITNLVLTGLLLLGFALGLRRTLHAGKSSVAGPALTAVFGLSLVVGGVAVADPFPGYPPGTTGPDTPTLHGTIHDLNGMVCFLVVGVAAIVLGRWFAGDPGRRPWWWYSLATGVLTPVSWLVCGVLVALHEDGTLPDAPYGLVQRAGIILGFGYFSLLALKLLRATRSAQATEARCR